MIRASFFSGNIHSFPSISVFLKHARLKSLSYLNGNKGLNRQYLRYIIPLCVSWSSTSNLYCLKIHINEFNILKMKGKYIKKKGFCVYIF